MQVGIGMPNTLPGTSGDLLVDWARRADAGPFASLGVLDRIVYQSFEPLVSLSAAAAVTRRIELVTSILISPLRETSTLTKQLASLYALAPGRLTVGAAIGARGEDYERSEFGRGTRGDRLTEQLATIRTLLEEGAINAAGPTPSPRLLVGGGSGPSYARAAQLADGWIHGGSPARVFARDVAEMRAAWADAGRLGRPEIWSMAYFALGDAEHRGREYLLDYYAFTGAFAPRIADGLLTSALDVREYLQAYEDAGCDHLILFPTVPGIEQLELLAEVVGGGRVNGQVATGAGGAQ
ncbi:LLM class flavin-dependent oxidoreductase [Egicoccus sp. AB-alg2]|uniref:LLM class flavin-dependent oxidoreductase n=1 Tax=Egicoccus sp. AB-alg2 TaxID=3242693 RepID=UPI00359EBDF3